MDILERIDNLRKSRGWSLYKLAEECEVVPSTLANMFARKTLPSITTLIAICNGLGITLSEFFSDDAERKEFIDEKELLKHYRKLTSKNKQAIIQFIKNVS